MDLFKLIFILKSAVITLLHKNKHSDLFEVSQQQQQQQNSRSSRSESVKSWYSTVFSLGNNHLSDLNNKNNLNEWDSIGKISINRKKLLGQGCSGTAVYERVFLKY